jgi:lysyl-tRNA synthetase class I
MKTARNILEALFHTTNNQFFTSISRRILEIFPAIPFSYWAELFTEPNAAKSTKLYFELLMPVFEAATPKQMQELEDLIIMVNNWIQAAIIEEKVKQTTILAELKALQSKMAQKHNELAATIARLAGLERDMRQARSMIRRTFELEIHAIQAGDLSTAEKEMLSVQAQQRELDGIENDFAAVSKELDVQLSSCM